MRSVQKSQANRNVPLVKLMTDETVSVWSLRIGDRFTMPHMKDDEVYVVSFDKRERRPRLGVVPARHCHRIRDRKLACFISGVPVLRVADQIAAGEAND